MTAASLLLVSLLAQDYYSPEEAQALFTQANEAYYRQDYAAARTGYEKLVARGLSGPDLLYNLGTTLLAQKDLGGAVLQLERAKRAGGAREDIEANLVLARAQQLDKVVGEGEEPWLSRWVEATDAQWVSGIFLSAWLGASALLFLAWLWKSGPRAKLSMGAVALLCVAALPAGALLGAHIWAAHHLHEAVVLSQTLPARDFPKETAKASFEVHAGLKVRVLEEAGPYVKIRLPNGLEGWALKQGVANL